MGKKKDAIFAAGVFLCSAALLWWLAGRRLALINDEGIYLDGARRLLQGSLPYRDFFVLTGPGTYWNVALFFKLFGVSLASARALLIADLALIAACLFWITAQCSSRALGLWLAWFYIFLLAGDAGGLVVNHRWDSSAFSLLGIALTFYGLREGRTWILALAGACLAYSAWITPPELLVLASGLVWILVKNRWRGAAPYLGGVGVVSAAALAALWSTHSLSPMVQHFLWTSSQYSSANRFAYGHIIGGYRALFDDVSGIDFAIRAFFVFFVVLSAVAPICALLAFVFARQLWRSPLAFLLLAAGAAVIACAPRLDVAHLTYAAPLSYVVAACALAVIVPRRLRAPLVVTLSLGACTLTLNGVHERMTLETLDTPAGVLNGKPNDIALVRELDRAVPPGSTFFAFPYIPLAYFLTQGDNPTRYSFLQPGMMADADEESALAALSRNAPAKILYMDVPAWAYLRLFPSSDPARLRMNRIEHWLERNYTRDETFSRAHAGYDLLLPRTAPAFVALR